MKPRLLERLAVRFKDKEYRDAYAESFLSTTIAAQIKALRDQRRWSQKELGDRAGMKQSQISRLENVNYSGWTIQTLLRLARAFDVALEIRFASFSSVAVGVEKISRSSLEVPSFDTDTGFRVDDLPRMSVTAAEIEVPPAATPMRGEGGIGTSRNAEISFMPIRGTVHTPRTPRTEVTHA